MAASKLPDEMLHEILSPTLNIPDEKFASTERVSPFSIVFQSSSTILLVCKRWLRVSYPLLYHTVVIRSSSQAWALAHSLKSNKNLGPYIRKLCLEGGYGSAMEKILTVAPNITDLFLTLAIWSGDSVSGLCRSLGAINPSRVLLHDDASKTSFHAKPNQLLLKLLQCIPLWSNLLSFHIPYYTCRPIAKALKMAPNLKIVTYPAGFVMSDDCITISHNKSLETIFIKCSFRLTVPPLPQTLDENVNAKLRDLVKFVHVPSTEESQRIQQSTVSYLNIAPLEEASLEVREKIWSRILAFALYVDLEQLAWGESLQKLIVKNWRSGLLLVSRTFYRLALPHFYSYPFVLGNRILFGFAERLVSDISLGLHLRSLVIWTGGHNLTDNDQMYDKALMDILSRAPRLTHVSGSTLRPVVRLHGCSLSWRTFCVMADTCGPSLLEFNAVTIFDKEIICESPPFHPFTALRSLFWNCAAQFDVSEGENLRKCFPRLESLRLFGCHDSFTKLLSHMDLPMLSRCSLTVSTDIDTRSFLEKHGHKLYELELVSCYGLPVFDLCPSIRVLTFISDNPSSELRFFRCARPHQSLTKIVMSHRCLSPMVDVYRTFFNSLNVTHFPALREINVTECYWTTVEHEILKNQWISRAEVLLKSGVALTDKDGQRWRPRLKRSR